MQETAWNHVVGDGKISVTVLSTIEDDADDLAEAPAAA